MSLMQIHEALAKYVLQLEADGRSTHTIDQYRRHVGALARAHAGPIDTVTHEALARFLVSPVARLRADGRPKKATAMNSMRTSLRTFFRYLAAAGELEHDPARLLRRARCGTPPPKSLTAAEQERLLTVLRVIDGGRDYALFHTLLGTGLRISSALGLEVSDVDLDQGELHVRHAKNDRPSTVVMPRDVRDHLNAYLAGLTEGPVFPRISRRHANARLKFWLGKAGITVPASVHTLRHCFAMRVYGQTGDLLLTQAALGHASLISTAIYAKVDQSRLRAALGA